MMMMMMMMEKTRTEKPLHDGKNRGPRTDLATDPATDPAALSGAAIFNTEEQPSSTS
jgi:hypothetical protein